MKHTFIKMGKVGVGLGLGEKDIRAVFIFCNPETIKGFVEHGNTLAAEATAKANDKGWL